MARELREVVEAGGQLDYDTVMRLPYLNAVYKETLRMYPPITL